MDFKIVVGLIISTIILVVIISLNQSHFETFNNETSKINANCENQVEYYNSQNNEQNYLFSSCKQVCGKDNNPYQKKIVGICPDKSQVCCLQKERPFKLILEENNKYKKEVFDGDFIKSGTYTFKLKLDQTYDFVEVSSSNCFNSDFKETIKNTKIITFTQTIDKSKSICSFYYIAKMSLDNNKVYQSEGKVTYYVLDSIIKFDSSKGIVDDQLTDDDLYSKYFNNNTKI